MRELNVSGWDGLFIMSLGDGLRNEAWLDVMSSVGAYEEPRMSGVPLSVNLGVPSFHDGMETWRKGSFPDRRSSAVCDFASFCGFDITTLKAPASVSSSPGVTSRMVESDTARRCRVGVGLESKYALFGIPFGEGGSVIGVGVHWLLFSSPNPACCVLQGERVSKPAVVGGVIGNVTGGWGYL